MAHFQFIRKWLDNGCRAHDLDLTIQLTTLYPHPPRSMAYCCLMLLVSSH